MGRISSLSKGRYRKCRGHEEHVFFSESPLSIVPCSIWVSHQQKKAFLPGRLSEAGTKTGGVHPQPLREYTIIGAVRLEIVLFHLFQKNDVTYWRDCHAYAPSAPVTRWTSFCTAEITSRDEYIANGFHTLLLPTFFPPPLLIYPSNSSFLPSFLFLFSLIFYFYSFPGLGADPATNRDRF